jgi:signal transduction histidine kinase
MTAPTRSPAPESSDNPERGSAQAAIAELGQVSLVQTEISAVFDTAIYLICEVLDVELAKVLREVTPGEPLTLVAGCGWNADVEVGKATVPNDRHSQAGYTLMSKEPVVVEDLAGEERFQGPQLLTSHGVVSGISVTIPGLNGPYGVVGAHTARRREFVPADADFMRSVANVLGSAVESHRIREEIEGRVRHEMALADCAQALLASTGEDRLEQALEALLISTQSTYVFVERNVMDADLGFCSLTLAEVEAADAHSYELGNEYWELVPWSQMPTSREHLESGRPFNLIPAQLEGIERELYADDPYPVKSELDIPIVVDGEWAGLIGFADMHVERTWSESDISLLTTAARMIGAFWEREAAQHRLEEMNQAKDEFLASISHELRTPLTSVMGYAQLLRDSDDDLSGVQRREAAERVLKQATDLDHIVNDLLVAAKAEMGELTVSRVPVDLFAQTAQVLEEYGERTSKVTVAGPRIRALADPARVRQILRNLITNALRYGGDQIRVEVLERQGAAVVCVVDNGRGIPEEDRDRIFQPRQRVAATPGLTAALGLGLAISSQLAQMMGGDLAYRYEGESYFELSLPVSS